MSHIPVGMCRPKGYGFWAILVWKWKQNLPILLWGQVRFLREPWKCIRKKVARSKKQPRSEKQGSTPQLRSPKRTNHHTPPPLPPWKTDHCSIVLGPVHTYLGTSIHTYRIWIFWSVHIKTHKRSKYDNIPYRESVILVLYSKTSVFVCPHRRKYPEAEATFPHASWHSEKSTLS